MIVYLIQDMKMRYDECDYQVIAQDFHLKLINIKSKSRRMKTTYSKNKGTTFVIHTILCG